VRFQLCLPSLLLNLANQSVRSLIANKSCMIGSSWTRFAPPRLLPHAYRAPPSVAQTPDPVMRGNDVSFHFLCRDGSSWTRSELF
jgi:hypothetical protein